MTASCPHTLDDDHIRAAAVWSAHALRDRGQARVVVTPGDDTSYELYLLAPAPVWAGRDERDDLEYVVAYRYGDTHPWAGWPDVHPNYAARSWGRGSGCTGEVIARFLNALGDAIPEVAAMTEEGQGS